MALKGRLEGGAKPVGAPKSRGWSSWAGTVAFVVPVPVTAAAKSAAAAEVGGTGSEDDMMLNGRLELWKGPPGAMRASGTGVALAGFTSRLTPSTAAAFDVARVFLYSCDVKAL